MNGPFDWWPILGDKGQLALAGFFGGAVRWMTLREHWSDGLISLAVGTISATYATPLVEPALRQLMSGIVASPDGITGFSGFLVGIGGITVSGFALDFWREFRRRANGGDGE